jgi:HEAT repeat protein
MTTLVADAARLALVMLWIGVALALSMLAAVVIERLGFAYREANGRVLEQRYAPLIARALDGDRLAEDTLVASPARHRLKLAWMLVPPLITNRDGEHIARTRHLFEAMSLPSLVDRYLRSPFWWRRALALRALGLLQMRGYTATIVAALDDPHEDVRGAALDALADLKDPASLPAIVVRIHDVSLHRGRRGAVLAAFGSQCEPLLLEWSQLHPEQRENYALALGICGTARSRPLLCRWTTDPRAEVRAAALLALAHVGLDNGSAPFALDALESADEPVREMAAFALHGWTGPGNAASRLARHLDDTWTVALRAARSLQSMREAGLAELRACAGREGTAGLLARQMVWESRAA